MQRSLGDLRIFPSFSWNGKCDSRERSESEHRRCVADFPQLQLEWKMRQQGEKLVEEEIDDYIVFFNEQRPAYSLHYLTPKQYREANAG